MSDIELIILGCGGSTAVPTIGNRWGQCDPNEPKNQRLRPSALVRSKTTAILIDTGPDLRQQFNRIGQDDIDAVLYTHAHADHINGMDELRPLSIYNKKVYDLYGNKPTMQEIEQRFDYMFNGSPDGFYKPHAKTNIVKGSFSVGDIKIDPVEQIHGNITSLGYRFGNIAYCTDVSDLPKSSLNLLKNLDVWIIDAGNGFNDSISPVHANVKQVMSWVDILKPKQTYLTHLTMVMDYQDCLKRLPDQILPAYDGMIIKGKGGIRNIPKE